MTRVRASHDDQGELNSEVVTLKLMSQGYVKVEEYNRLIDLSQLPRYLRTALNQKGTVEVWWFPTQDCYGDIEDEH